MLDVLIRGGWVADGTGNPRYPSDVAIAGDRVVEVGRLEGATAQRVIDATGKIVCPGFVDAHSHSDWSLLANPTAESTTRQGVTTEVVGNCGESFAPFTELARAHLTDRLALYGYAGPITWSSFGEYLEVIRQLGTSANLAWFVGHNTLRVAAGVAGSIASEDELRAMESFVAEAMDAGALGLSTGLEYGAGREAETPEIVRLAKVVGRRHGYYASHIRNRDAHLEPAVEEFLTVAREGGTRAELSHLNVRDNTGAAEGAWQRSVDSVERARESGVDVLMDTTPFLEGLGMMAGLLPAWLLEPGPAFAAQQLRDPAVRQRVRQDSDRYWRFIQRGEWDRVRLQSSGEFPELAGKNFLEISELMGQDPWDSYFDIMAAAGPRLNSLIMIGRLFTEEHMAEMITHPLFNLAVDIWSTRVDGPLSEQTRHPLYFSGHITYLTRYVRKLGLLRLEDVIRKMTSMPATHFNLRDRGLVRKGSFADVVVFDYRTLEGASTIDQPLAYARGIEHVLVNGTPIVADGEHTGARPGRNILRAS
ncbi:MAG: amidohydrolase family protein [Chloroflexi bacterium]|nr:amidohydrolase family protein [Chloroflexota bacterium]